MRSIYLPLPRKVADSLIELARREMRHPRQQAVLLIVDGLRRRGLLEVGPQAETLSHREVAGRVWNAIGSSGPWSVSASRHLRCTPARKWYTSISKK